MDCRFSSRRRDQLPKWIAQGILESDVSMSIDMAVASAKKFLRTMAQPSDPEDQNGVSVWNEQQVRDYQEKQRLGHVGKAGLQPMDLS